MARRKVATLRRVKRFGSRRILAVRVSSSVFHAPPKTPSLFDEILGVRSYHKVPRSALILPSKESVTRIPPSAAVSDAVETKRSLRHNVCAVGIDV